MRHGGLDSGFTRCINAARNARSRTACVRIAVKRLRTRKYDPAYRMCIALLPTLKNSGFLATGGEIEGGNADGGDGADSDDDADQVEEEEEEDDVKEDGDGDGDDDGDELLADDKVRKVYRTRVVYKVRPRHIRRRRTVRRVTTKWNTKWRKKDVVVWRTLMKPVTRTEAITDARYIRNCIRHAIARRDDRRRKVKLANKIGAEMRKAQSEIMRLKASNVVRKRPPPKITKRIIRVVVGRLGPSRAAKVIRKARKLGWTERRLFYYAMGLKHPLLPKDNSVTSKGNLNSVYRDRVHKIAKRRFRKLARRFLRSYFEGGPTGEARNVKMGDNDPFKMRN